MPNVDILPNNISEVLVTDLILALDEEFGVDLNTFIHQINERIFKGTFKLDDDYFVTETVNKISLLPRDFNYKGKFTVLPLYPL